MNKPNLFLALWVLFLFASCNIKTYEGGETTEKRKVEEYSGLHIKGPFDVRINTDNRAGVSITAPSDAVPDITTEVRNGILVIDLDARGFTTQSFDVAIGNAELDEISMSGSGSFEGEILSKDKLTLEVGGSGFINAIANPRELEADVSGSGSIKASGKCESLEAEISGSGSISMRNMESKNADVSISGSGSMSTNVSGELKASISGSGSISYTGNPEKVDKSVSGSGSVSSF